MFQLNLYEFRFKFSADIHGEGASWVKSTAAWWFDKVGNRAVD
jgi:hypothetical protein